MNESLNEEFDRWLGRIALEWAIPKSDVPLYLGVGEIGDRVKCYPSIGRAIANSPIHMSDLANAGKECWALGQQHDAIKFNEFASNTASAEVVSQLIANFPSDDETAATRIDSFIEDCALLGYADTKTKKLVASSAALLASVLLTAAIPKRFVDFRQTRWKELADELNYQLLNGSKPTYGQMIIAAGRFAKEICATEVFRELWSEGEPLWVIAGICWHANSDAGAERPKDVEMYFYEEDYDEGAMQLRSHLIRERNFTVVRRAKELWKESDPSLHCDVCGFSFLKTFGERGEGYIEAHHTKPIHTLKAGSKTKVSDLAKVCANCHRMIHIGNQCLEIEELRTILHNRP